MNKRVFLALSIILFLNIELNGQDRLKHIKEEYYRINKETDLSVINLFNHTYYLENNKIVKSETTDSLGIYEFYYEFDYDKGDYNVMFMYLQPNSSTLPDARFYFKKSGYIFLYKENNQELKFDNANKTLKILPIKPYNALNIFQNTFKESLDQYSIEKLHIDSLFRTIENSSLKKINTKAELYSEEDGQYFESGDIHFVNKNKQLVKKLNKTGGNHGTSRHFKYFDNGRLILEIEESDYYINGFQYNVNKKYYLRYRERDIVFREERYQNYDVKLNSTYGTNELLSFYIDGIIPEITLKR